MRRIIKQHTASLKVKNVHFYFRFTNKKMVSIQAFYLRISSNVRVQSSLPGRKVTQRNNIHLVG